MINRLRLPRILLLTLIALTLASTENTLAQNQQPQATVILFANIGKASASQYSFDIAQILTTAADETGSAQVLEIEASIENDSDALAAVRSYDNALFLVYGQYTEEGLNLTFRFPLPFDAIPRYRMTLQGIEDVDFLTYVIQAMIYERQSDFDRAIEAFDSAEEVLPPDHADALAIELLYINRGAARYRSRDNEGAAADFETSIDLFPTSGGYFWRGVILSEDGDFDDAIASFSRAILLDPSDMRCYYSRGIAYRNLGNYERAEADFTRGLELLPDLVALLMLRGQVRYRMDELQGALDDFSRVIYLAPDYTSAYVQRGYVYALMGDYVNALANYRLYEELGGTVSPQIQEQMDELEAIVETPSD
jgi:tetratricopeptide (TPR) repeat protein